MNATFKASTDRQTAINLGFWFVILASVFTIFFVVIAVVTVSDIFRIGNLVSHLPHFNDSAEYLFPKIEAI